MKPLVYGWQEGSYFLVIDPEKPGHTNEYGEINIDGIQTFQTEDHARQHFAGRFVLKIGEIKK